MRVYVGVESEGKEIIVESGTVVKFGPREPPVFAGSLIEPADQVLETTAARSMVQYTVDKVLVRE